jgi:hypothetical protein
MPVTIRDKDYGFKRIELDFKALRGRGVKIGLMGNDQVEGVSVVDYATYNEFGTSRIPARPFMQTTADTSKEEITKFTEYLVGRMIDGKVTDTTVLQNLGAKYQSLVQNTIRDAKNWAVPNAESTVAMKGSTSPLIDTGRLVGAVRYEVI